MLPCRVSCLYPTYEEVGPPRRIQVGGCVARSDLRYGHHDQEVARTEEGTCYFVVGWSKRAKSDIVVRIAEGAEDAEGAEGFWMFCPRFQWMDVYLLKWVLEVKSLFSAFLCVLCVLCDSDKELSESRITRISRRDADFFV